MGAGRSGCAAWVDLRAAPVAATIAALVAVMTISVGAHPLWHAGRGGLFAPGDLWSLADSSTAFAHGHFSQIYVHDGALTSPPALELVLAPVVALGQLLGLAPHLGPGEEPPGLWLVLGPTAVLVGSSVLFALDAVARRWHVPRRSRLALALAGGLGVANVAGVWGHPEDCVAVALVVWAALAMEEPGRAGARRAALLLGVGVAFQPLALVGVVPVLARLPWRAAARLVPRLVLPTLAVLAAPLLAEPRRTLFVLVRQPFQPAYVSFTPLTHVAPVLAPGVDSGGPTRLLALALAAGLALAVCRRRHDLATVLGVCAVGFFLRTLFETEMNWYYLWPVPALCLLLALRRGPLRLWVCTVALVASVVLGDRRVHQLVPWWPALVATTGLMLLCAAPRRSADDAAGAAGGGARPVECGAMVDPAGWGPPRE